MALLPLSDKIFTFFNISTESSRVKGVDSDTFQWINPNFRVGQPQIFVKIKVVFILCFKQKYIIEKNLLCLIVWHCMMSWLIGNVAQ